MTDKETVQAVHRNAHAWHSFMDDRWHVNASTEDGNPVIGEGLTEESAWSAAASNLPDAAPSVEPIGRYWCMKCRGHQVEAGSSYCKACNEGWAKEQAALDQPSPIAEPAKAARCYCSANQGICMYCWPKPTPTVIPDAKDEREALRSALEDILRHCDASSDGETQFEKDVIAARKALESKPLPSEPAEGEHIEVPLVIREELARLPSLSLQAALLKGWAIGLAAKAEKVEEFWPEAVVSDDKVYELSVASKGWFTENERKLAVEVKAYREIKKRSVGGVK